MKIKAIQLSQQERKEWLTDAIETCAIQYWACGDNNEPIKVWRDDDGLIYKATVTLTESKGEKHGLGLATVQLGVNAILNGTVPVDQSIIDQITDDDNDSDSLDAIIQAGLFGRIIYG